MLYREIIAVCSEIHTKHINTPCGQNVQFVLAPAVHIVTAGLQRVQKMNVPLRYVRLEFNLIFIRGRLILSRCKTKTIDSQHTWPAALCYVANCEKRRLASLSARRQ